MTNILLITNKIHSSPQGGREMLCKLNFDILKKIYQDNFFIYELSSSSINGIKNILSSFSGKIDGLNTNSINEIVNSIHKNNISKIFIDGSNLGAIAKIIKEKFPKIKIYTFFHNVESRFFLGALKERKSLRSMGVFAVNYLSERKAVNYSDSIICINKRDSNLLKKIYKKEATEIYPMSLEDQFKYDDSITYNKPSEKYSLFVGGTFYANRVGIFWFVKNVLPHVNMNVYIVGRGFEKYKKELEISDKVKVIGSVDELQEWYIKAEYIIAPIFDGSGMKTKVAEALMYGKRVIGTKESFTGYEDFIDEVGTMCNTTDEFINSIKLLEKEELLSFDKNLRKIYENNFSYTAAETRLKNILKVNDEN